MADNQSDTTSNSVEIHPETGEEKRRGESEEEEPVDSQKPILVTYCCEIWSLVHTQTAKSNASNSLISPLKE